MHIDILQICNPCEIHASKWIAVCNSVDSEAAFCYYKMQQQINKLQYSKCKKAKKRIIYRLELNGINLKNCQCARKKSPGKSVNRFASATWKKFCEKLSLCNEDKERKKKWMCLAKSQYYINKILWKTIIVQWKERRKNLSEKKWINSLMLWTKFFEKLSLCNEGKERMKKRLSLFLFLPFFAIKAPQGGLLLQPVKKGLFRQDQNFTEHLKGVPKDNQSTHTPI